MISLEKWIILTPLQKMPKNVGDLGKLIVAKGFVWLPKVQKIAKSGHTGAWAVSFHNSVEQHTCVTVPFYVTAEVIENG